MKLSNIFLNAITIYAALVAAALIAGLRQVPFSLRVPVLSVWFQTLFKYITGMFCATNLLGIPRHFVDDLWERTIFGETFIPTSSLTNSQKRVLAGLGELVGIALTDSIHWRVRATGYAILMIMFGRGALINTRISMTKAMIAGSVAAVAGWFFLEHIQ